MEVRQAQVVTHTHTHKRVPKQAQTPTSFKAQKWQINGGLVFWLQVDNLIVE